MKKSLYIIVPVLVCFLVGYSASLFQATSLTEWYPYLYIIIEKGSSFYLKSIPFRKDFQRT